MNQDVLNIQQDTTSNLFTDRLNWDWHNPLITLPLATIGVLAASAVVVILKLLGS